MRSTDRHALQLSSGKTDAACFGTTNGKFGDGKLLVQNALPWFRLVLQNELPRGDRSEFEDLARFRNQLVCLVENELVNEGTSLI